MIVIQTLSIIFFALISAVIPQYAFLIFILYFIIFMGLMMRTASKSFKKVSQEKLGSPLFKEDNALKATTYDPMLASELKRQMSFAFMSFIPLLLIFVLLPVYGEYIAPYLKDLISSLTSNEVIQNFVSILGMYLFFMAITQIFRFLLFRKPGQQQFMMPRSFIVYKKGVVIDSQRLLEFTSNLCFKDNPDRKYVELKDMNSGINVRLYTLEVSKLVSRLKEVGLNECKTG